MTAAEITTVDRPAGRATIAGWKGIAAYFGRDERTVMRWAVERGLPVRRMPGQKRASVYALPDELAAWRDAAAPVAAAPVAFGPMPAGPPVPAPAGRRRRWLLPAAGVVAVIGIGIAATTLPTARPRPERPRLVPTASADPVAEAAYLQASYDFAQRSAGSLKRAVAEYRTAIAADPRSAASYAGLGETYLLLRQYSDMPDAEAYAEARAAADAAVAIDPDLPAARRVLAFVAFWSSGDVPAARTEFARALALAAVLRGDKAGLALVAAARRGAAGGHAAMLRAMYAARADARRPDGSWFPLAQIAALQGNRDQALELLRRAQAARDPAMMTVNAQGAFAVLRTDPRFIAIARRPSLQL